MKPIAILAILILGMTDASATEPLKVAEGVCTVPWGETPCDKYLYKGNVYILVWKDGEQLIFQAPTRYWT